MLKRRFELQKLNELGNVNVDRAFLGPIPREEFLLAGWEGSDVDLSAAHLEQNGKEFPHARDAQAASHKPARAQVTKDGTVVTAFFEVPMDALGKGLTLVVPDGAKTAQLELQ